MLVPHQKQGRGGGARGEREVCVCVCVGGVLLFLSQSNNTAKDQKAKSDAWFTMVYWYWVVDIECIFYVQLCVIAFD